MKGTVTPWRFSQLNAAREKRWAKHMSMTAREIFEARLAPRIIKDGSGCWNWPGWKNERGYGVFRRSGKAHYTHRLAFEAFKGAIPEGLHIDHLCRNTSCCNPDHLEAVTLAENNRRASATRVLCPSGHALDGTRGKNGERCCRTCRRDSARKATGRTFRENDRIDIISLAAFGATVKDLSAAFGISRISVSQICAWANGSRGRCAREEHR